LFISGAEARADIAGFMRGLKPPPPSASSFSAACLAPEGEFGKVCFPSEAKAGDQNWFSMYGLKPVPFKPVPFKAVVSEQVLRRTVDWLKRVLIRPIRDIFYSNQAGALG
jgi:hypothetical protein